VRLWLCIIQVRSFPPFPTTISIIETDILVERIDCGLTLTTDPQVSAALEERSKDELARFDVKDYCFTEYVCYFDKVWVNG
jgi:hypothetical protein